MIRGIVNADREAILRLLVCGLAGQQRKVKALIDTGFNSWLITSACYFLTNPKRKRGQLPSLTLRVGEVLSRRGNSLPPPLITLLRLPWRRRGRAILADGSETPFDIYEGTVIWGRRRRLIPIYEVDAAPLVGMALLDGYELNVQVRSRGKVTIQVLP